MARTHLDQKIHRGERGRRCGLPLALCLYAQGSRWTIQTISPAFDGLKVFPSLAGFHLTTIPCFGRRSVRTCQPAGVSAHRVVRTCPTVRRVTGSQLMLRC